MKRYMFYDKKTGEIVHTHQVHKINSDKLLEVSEADLQDMANRMVDLATTKYLVTQASVQSSRRVARHVRPKKGKLVSKKLPKDYWQKQAEMKTKPYKNLKKGGR